MKDNSTGGFFVDYTRMLLDSVGNNYGDNYDAYRFGPSPWRIVSRIRDLASSILSRFLTSVGLVRTKTMLSTIDAGMCLVRPHLVGLEWLHARLADQESRDLMVSVVAIRALGHRKVKLAFNRPAYWENLRRMEVAARNTESIDAAFAGWQLYKLDMRPFGFPLSMFTTAAGAAAVFLEEQYRCVAGDGVIEVSEDGIAIDAGGCWGDTALYFAAKVGAKGRVFSFEFLPSNLEIFRRNLELNPHLKDRVVLVENAAWSSSELRLHVNGNGPGTRVEVEPSSPDSPVVQTLSIDDLVERHGLQSLDFIKMDIEGAELPALMGAERSIRRFRPKLAISVYHKLPDLWQIAQYLDALSLGYRFYLRHFTIHSEETVLFAESAGDAFRRAREREPDGG